MQEIQRHENSGKSNDFTRLAALNKAELEPIVIDAMREHQRLMESDQAVFDEWERAKSDCSIPFEQVESLEAQCQAQRKEALAQQDRLSDLLDLLGYIPKVPEDCRENSCSDDVTSSRGGHDPLRSRRHG